MIEILKKIFWDNKYLQANYSEDITLFWRKWEYFIVMEYTKIEILDFFICKKTNDLLLFFDKEKLNSVDIEKNTSLIILLKVEELWDDFKEIKNQIMKIEEDEYFFRKYIIVYDDKWINGIKNINSTDELNSEITKIDLEEFRKDNFENSKWYLIIQLFIKLPFLNLKVKKIELENLLDKINNNIEKSKLNELNDFILKKTYSDLISNEDSYFEKLENDIMDEKNKEIDKYLEQLIK